MSCPGCAIITSLLITLKKMSFLVSSILQTIFSCLTIFLLLGKFYIYSCKSQNGIPSHRGLLPGQGVFTIWNCILPGKETN